MKTKIDLTLARKVVEIVDFGLTDGIGNPVPGQTCVEGAITLALGEDHSDSPSCVECSIGDYKIMLNDKEGWKSKMDRAKGLRRIAVAQLGSIGLKEFTRTVGEIIWKAGKKAELSKDFMDEVTWAIGEEGDDCRDGTDLANCAFDLGKKLLKKNRLALDFAVEVGIAALRKIKSPGIKLMDRLIKEGVL